MATIRGSRINDDGTVYWIFFEQGDMEKPLLMLHDVVLKEILRYEGYDMVMKVVTKEDFLDKVKEKGVLEVLSPDKIDFTIEKLDLGLFKLKYAEHFGELPPELEEKFEGAMEATIGLVKQQIGFTESVERIERGVCIETKPLPPQVIMTALMAEFASMMQGVYPLSKLQEAMVALQEIFGAPLPSPDIKPLEERP